MDGQDRSVMNVVPLVAWSATNYTCPLAVGVKLDSMVKVASTTAVTIAYMRTSSHHATKTAGYVAMDVLLAIGGVTVRNHVKKAAMNLFVIRQLENVYMDAI